MHPHQNRTRAPSLQNKRRMHNRHRRTVTSPSLRVRWRRRVGLVRLRFTTTCAVLFGVLVTAVAVAVAVTVPAVVAEATGGDGSQLSNENRIINGRNVPVGKYPFFVQVHEGCGGVLVARDVVLTAAHCGPPNRIGSGHNRAGGNRNRRGSGQVLVGSVHKSPRRAGTDRNQHQDRDRGEGNGQWYTVVPDSFIRHPKYNQKTTMNNDLMLFRIEQPQQQQQEEEEEEEEEEQGGGVVEQQSPQSQIQSSPPSSAVIEPIRIGLNEGHPKPGRTLTVIGFGATNRAGTRYSDRLLETQVKVVNDNTCDIRWSNGYYPCYDGKDDKDDDVAKDRKNDKNQNAKSTNTKKNRNHPHRRTRARNKCVRGRIDADAMVCAMRFAGYKQTGDSCYGDSGGPLFDYDDDGGGVSTLMGIVSFGYSCSDSYYPGVYAKLTSDASNLRWLQNQICQMTRTRPKPSFCPSTSDTSSASTSTSTSTSSTTTVDLDHVDSSNSGDNEEQQKEDDAHDGDDGGDDDEDKEEEGKGKVPGDESNTDENGDEGSDKIVNDRDDIDDVGKGVDEEEVAVETKQDQTPFVSFHGKSSTIPSAKGDSQSAHPGPKPSETTPNQTQQTQKQQPKPKPKPKNYVPQPPNPTKAPPATSGAAATEPIRPTPVSKPETGETATETTSSTASKTSKTTAAATTTATNPNGGTRRLRRKI